MNKAAKIIFSIMLACILGVGCFVGGIKVTQHKEAQIQETVSEDAQDFGYRDGYDTASEEKAAEIADLEAEIEDLTNSLADLQNRLKAVKTEEEYNELVAQIAELSAQIVDLQSQLAEAQEGLAQYETIKESRKYGLFTDEGKLIMSLSDMEEAGILAHNGGTISRGVNFDPDLIYGHLVLPTGIGEGHSYIANETFKDTTKLKSVTGEFYDIGKNAFENSSIEKITVSSQWGAQTTIDNSAFKNCKKLETVYLGATINIEGYAFYGCESLTKVTGGLLNDPDTVATEFGIGSNQIRRLGGYAFAYSGITYAVISSLDKTNGRSEYGSHIYEGCANMTYANVSFCGEYQFKDCTSLETVYLNVTSYPENALQGCTSLQNIYPD